MRVTRDKPKAPLQSQFLCLLPWLPTPQDDIYLKTHCYALTGLWGCNKEVGLLFLSVRLMSGRASVHQGRIICCVLCEHLADPTER